MESMKKLILMIILFRVFSINSIVIVSTVIFSEKANAKIIHVTADQPTIQAGIDVATHGDTVLVADGIYVGDDNRDIDFKGKAIVVKSVNGADATIIDCQGTSSDKHRGFYFHNGENFTSVLDGFTIKNGYGPNEMWGSYSYSVGGGIYCTNASPKIVNNIIMNNSASYGGGIQCYDYASPFIDNNIVTSNSSGKGAGIYCYVDCATTITNNIIDNNVGSGAQIDAISSVFMSHNLISQNSGRGIYIGNSSPVIMNNTVTGNNSGGLYLWYASPTIVNSIFWGDTTTTNNEISLSEGSTIDITYSDIEGGWSGVGNIDSDPMFVDSDNGDFHLMPGSPCIDTGDPASPLDPDGTVSDMGAYPIFQYRDVLIWSPLSITHTSAVAIQDALTANGKTSVILVNLPLYNLCDYGYIFVCLGIFPVNYVLGSTDPEVTQLVNYLNTGGRLYMEGGDTWAWDIPTSLHAMFKITGVSDGSDDLNTVLGSACLEGMDFTYSGDNYFIDQIVAQDTALVFHSNNSPDYTCGVAYDYLGGSYRTIGTSFQFGGLDDGSASIYTKADLMGAYLNFFDNGCTYVPPSEAPSDLYAFSGYDGAIPLAWDAPAGFQPLLNNQLEGTLKDALVNKPIIPDTFHKNKQRPRMTKNSIEPNEIQATLQSYNVYRSEVEGGPYTMIASNVNRQYFRDETVTDGNSYYYVATCVFDTGETDYSNEAMGTSQAGGYSVQSGWTATAPVLDGYIDPDEWTNASVVDITAQGVSPSVTLYVMNDNNHLYIGVDDPANTNLDYYDQIGLYFDEDHNHEWPSSSPSGEGNFWTMEINSDEDSSHFRGMYGWWPGNVGFDDEVPADGVKQSVSGSSGHAQYEVEIDLINSELNATYGDMIGFMIFSLIRSEDLYTGDWPPVLTYPWSDIWRLPAVYGDLTLATGSTICRNYDFTQQGWYMTSLPVIPNDTSVSTLFPTALGNMAFGWDPVGGAYMVETEIKTKYGYWIAIPGATTDQVCGEPLESYTIHCGTQGWYMIGSVSGSTDFTNPDDNPDSQVLSPAFGWNTGAGSYYTTTTLEEKEGYWAAVFGECDLTVGGGGGGLSKAFSQSDWSTFNRVHGSQPPDPPNINWTTGEMVQIPTTYSLSQNTPNPFNPTTTIRYQLPKNGYLTLIIYNMMGQEIKRLVEGNVEAGYHDVVWDGRSDLGSRVSSGVYIVMLKAGEYTQTRKLLLVQ